MKIKANCFLTALPARALEGVSGRRTGCMAQRGVPGRGCYWAAEGARVELCAARHARPSPARAVGDSHQISEASEAVTDRHEGEAREHERTKVWILSVEASSHPTV